MIGLERTIIPEFASSHFGIESASAIMAFIASFGISKAISNDFAGKWANKIGRKRLLVLGWLIAIPVPVMLWTADSWNVVIASNILLGISQGLTWSTTVIMKIDIAGAKNRGLAMGLNEFAGYLSVGLIAYLSGIIAVKFGIHPYPFYLGFAIAVLGFILSLFFVKDTAHFVLNEPIVSNNDPVKLTHSSCKKNPIYAITQAGLINNLNDGMIWGLFPIFLANAGFHLSEIAVLTAAYPISWGILQLIDGKMADKYEAKEMIFWGMLLQAIAIIGLTILTAFHFQLTFAITLGLGTALVYPTFFVAISNLVLPEKRAESIGKFRFWRDSGYVFGALISGFSADLLGVQAAIIIVGIITFISAIIVRCKM
jgi:MFS family permease